MFVYKNDVSQTTPHSERKVNKIKLKSGCESSLKKVKRLETPKKTSGKKLVKKLTQSNKAFLEQLGYTSKK